MLEKGIFFGDQKSLQNKALLICLIAHSTPAPMSERALVVRFAGIGSDVSNAHWNLEWFGQQRPTFLLFGGAQQQ